MKASRIHLMKVPFDNSYTNVYDFPDGLVDNDIVFARLSALGFETKIIDFNRDKYFISINNNSIISLNINYDEVKDFNYAVVEYSEGYSIYKFYFITSIKSLNSGLNPTTEIAIEYDCWLNNIDKFYSSDIKQQIITGHVKDSIKSGNLYYPNSIHGASSDITLKESGADEPKRYKVLWLRIWMDTNDIYYLSNETYINSYSTGCYLTHSRTPILFVPYLVIDTLSMTAVYNYKWGGQYINGSVYVSPISNILKMDLTYYPPFNYSFNADNTITIGASGFFTFSTAEVYVNRGEGAYTPICIYRKKVLPQNPSSPQIPFPYPVVFMYHGDNDLASKVLFEEIDINKYSLYNYNKNTYLTNFIDQPIGQLYPYYFYSLLCNGTSNPIVFYKDSISCKVKIYSEKISPYYTLAFYDKDGLKVYESKPVFVQNTGSILTSYSAYDAYLRNNGNQLNMQYERLKTNALKSTVNNLVSFASYPSAKASGNFIKNTGFTLIDYYTEKKTIDARIEDIRNSQGVFNMPSIDANANIMQDIILLRTFAPSNKDEFNYIATTEHYFGKVINFADKITNCNKKIFDFKKIINPSIPFITNIDERNTLLSALENGITFWHYDPYLDGDFLDSIKTFNKQINNPDTEV